jgi:hypothetical protein
MFSDQKKTINKNKLLKHQQISSKWFYLYIEKKKKKKYIGSLKYSCFHMQVEDSCDSQVHMVFHHFFFFKHSRGKQNAIECK